ncbi:MAG: polysaccharide deacetylase family protein [Prosthecobacter sp.]|nr:polysaccharide deacetylase family protein [Prosthecobacter sp.]
MKRRTLLSASAALGGGLLLEKRAWSAEANQGKALVAITLDLEMARNFPRWEDTHWDYEKGNLSEAVKGYASEAARRVKAHGGLMHFFLVGRALEQDNVDWLKEIIAAGHSVGNHTYDHVNVKARKPAEIQFRFQRAPWLIEGHEASAVIRENIRLASAAMQSRLGIAPRGFRTPGGFANGLTDSPALQKMLLDLGFSWVSSKYPAHPNSKAGNAPDATVIAGILKTQEMAQPFRYPSGLIEVPMAPISDVGAFRNGRWKLESFLQVTKASLEHCIQNRLCFDFLSHPSVLGVMDPEFRAIEMICETVKAAGDAAELVTLDAFAARVA